MWRNAFIVITSYSIHYTKLYDGQQLDRRLIELAQLMHNRTELFKNLRLMIQGAQVLGIPILLTEQYPKGLGPTVPEVSELLPVV